MSPPVAFTSTYDLRWVLMPCLGDGVMSSICHRQPTPNASQQITRDKRSEAQRTDCMHCLQRAVLRSIVQEFARRWRYREQPRCTACDQIHLDVVLKHQHTTPFDLAPDPMILLIELLSDYCSAAPSIDLGALGATWLRNPSARQCPSCKKLNRPPALAGHSSLR